MKKCSMDKETAAMMKIAKVEVEGDTWDFRIGDHLRGKLSEGDIVVVEVPCGHGREGFFLKIGDVQSLCMASPHNPENVHHVVDKVRMGRYTKGLARERERAALDLAIRERAEMHERLSELSSIALRVEDDELEGMIERYKELLAREV